MASGRWRLRQPGDFPVCVAVMIWVLILEKEGYGSPLKDSTRQTLVRLDQEESGFQRHDPTWWHNQDCIWHGCDLDLELLNKEKLLVINQKIAKESPYRPRK